MYPVTRAPRTYKNLPAVIAEELREAILNGELQAGDKLKQEEIAQRFESSLIPAREALRNLESEGLVTFITNKGAFVSELSLEKVRDIFETRIFIELGALELSIPSLTSEDFKQAEAVVTRLDQDVSGKALSEDNQLFHSILYSRCGNAFLLELISNLHRNIERYMRRYLVDHLHNDRSQETHRKILEAARKQDAKQAKLYLEAHMRTAMDNLIEALQKNREA